MTAHRRFGSTFTTGFFNIVILPSRTSASSTGGVWLRGREQPFFFNILGIYYFRLLPQVMRSCCTSTINEHSNHCIHVTLTSLATLFVGISNCIYICAHYLVIQVGAPPFGNKTISPSSLFRVMSICASTRQPVQMRARLAFAPFCITAWALAMHMQLQKKN